MKPRFSILVVCLNPGEKINETLQSIKKQTFQDYEIIIKDGGSTDGTIEKIKKLVTCEEMESAAVCEEAHPVSECEKTGKEQGKGKTPFVRFVCKKDSGIYDAMNQAVMESKGEYVYFLNCGDVFADEKVLEDLDRFLAEHPVEKGIYYGNIYERMTGQLVASNPKLDAFGCYRNVPCHQACFYARELLLAHPFRTEYKVRADYEQFLWCFFKGEAKTVFTGRLIADYEGGGFSETKENRKRSAKEHKEIVKQYMNRGQILKYKLILWITLAPLRTQIAQNEKTAGLYNKLKSLLYGKT